jgi:hypothetical protein
MHHAVAFRKLIKLLLGPLQRPRPSLLLMATLTQQLQLQKRSGSACVLKLEYGGSSETRRQL